MSDKSWSEKKAEETFNRIKKDDIDNYSRPQSLTPEEMKKKNISWINSSIKE